MSGVLLNMIFPQQRPTHLFYAGDKCWRMLRDLENLIYIHMIYKNANMQSIKHKEPTKLESRAAWRTENSTGMESDL